MADIKMPKTGLAPEQAETKDLEYWATRIEKEIAEGTAKYPDADRKRAAAMRTELARRSGGSAQSAPQQSRAIAPAAQTHVAKPTQALVGGYHSASLVDAKLREAQENYHLVSPATSCGSLPEGCEVAISVVHVSPNTDKSGPGDVAAVGGGKLSLSGNVLKKIAAAAGVDWDPNLSRRLDSGSDPHYVHFRAVGYVRLFDGAVRTVTGEVEIDMREGSPQIAAMRARTTGNVDSQIRDTRLFIIRHAETKAKLRAIADMGVKRSYTAAELEKPFAVARLMFTGKTSDPELRRDFAGKIADHMLGGSRALYGGGQQQAPALPAPPASPQLHEPPPVGRVPADDEAYLAQGDPVRTPLPSSRAASPDDGGDAYQPTSDELAEEARQAGAY